MIHFCPKLDLENGPPFVYTLCGAEASGEDSAKVVWQGVDCPKCHALKRADDGQEGTDGT